MAISKMAVLLGAALAGAIRTTVDLTPMMKVQALLADLKTKVIEEGKTSDKTYAEFEKNCASRLQQLGFDIKNDKSGIENNKAKIAQHTGTQKEQQARAVKAQATIDKAEAQLVKAVAARKNESTIFVAQEKELVEMSAMLQRAISVLAQQGSSTKKSFAQIEGGEELTLALTALVQATSLSNAADAGKLQAFLQSTQEAADDFLAPPKKSGAIITVLEDLLAKATANLADLRKAEVANKHNFAMVEAALKNEASEAKRDLADATATATSAKEKIQTHTGDLAKATSLLETDTKTQTSFKKDCEERARDYKEEVQSRKEEIVALDKAAEILKKSTGAATAKLYNKGKASFLQIRSSKFSAVRLIQKLAEREKSTALAQLAAHMSAVVHLTGSADPFEKVKGLIKSMLTKLEADAKSEASQKAFCDAEMKKTETAKGGKESESSKLQAKIDQAKSRSASLKQDVVALKAALTQIGKSQAAMDAQRAAEKKGYDKNVPEMEQGIKGVELAINVLRNFYSKTGRNANRAGASGGIIGMLEVVEADFSKNLAETKAAESDAVKAYKDQSQKNKLDSVAKSEEAKFKTKEAGEVDVSVTQIEGDSTNVKTELKAITEYLEKLKGQCIAKPEPYEERAKRREQEIAGLKQAMEILKAQ